MTIEVRPAGKPDVHGLSRVLARAFQDDPVMTWIFPDAEARVKRLPVMFATMTRYQFLPGGGVEVASRSGTVGAATLWDPPGRTTSPITELVMMPGFLWAFRSRVNVAQEVLDAMKRVHPEEPHWYLNVIGSDPTVRGKGFGQALMQSRLDRCDREHAPAYLEATKTETVPYYMRFGFEVTGEIKVPKGGPSLWPMWRNPR